MDKSERAVMPTSERNRHFTNRHSVKHGRNVPCIGRSKMNKLTFGLLLVLFCSNQPFVSSQLLASQLLSPQLVASSQPAVSFANQPNANFRNSNHLYHLNRLNSSAIRLSPFSHANLLGHNSPNHHSLSHEASNSLTHNSLSHSSNHNSLNNPSNPISLTHNPSILSDHPSSLSSLNNLNSSPHLGHAGHSPSHPSLSHSLSNLLNFQNVTKLTAKVTDSNCKDIVLASELHEQHCLCSLDAVGYLQIDCDGVPVLTDHNLVVNPFVAIARYSQRNAGMYLLGGPLFTNVNGQIQLRSLDLQHNNLKKLISRLFEGVEQSLEYLNLSHNLLGENLNPIFSTNEFLELKNLKSLDLAYNGLQILDSNLLIGLKQLNELNLESNHLTAVPTASLKVLDKLVKLSIGNNLITKLENGSFPGALSSLLFLNLSYNRIESIAPDAFTQLGALTELYLSNNQLKELKINELNNLEISILDLSENLFKAVPAELNLKRLRKLSLAGNRITSIEENDFAQLSRLEYIDLSKNLIRSLSSQAFQYLTDLTVLNLASNAISKQSELSFNLLRNQLTLELLDISDNGITAFPFQLLINQKNLKKLFLDYNHIDELTNEMLQSLENLEEISISFNQINELRDGLFYYNQNLKLINLHGNRIANVSDTVFIGCSDNLLGLDVGYNDLAEVPRLVMPKLIILNLSLNQFRGLSKDSFINLPSLIYLNLSNALVDHEPNTVPSSIFDYNRQLEFLDLSANQIELIEYGAFRNLSLTKVNLSKNKLKELETGTFGELLNLEYLDLSSNQISFIKNGAFDEVPKLRNLNLSKNKLQAFRGELFTSTRTQLEKLNLCQNSINYLYPSSFNVHRKLKSLLLCSNALNYFSTELISSIGGLEVIDLSSNRLKSLDTNNFSNLQKLKKLKLNNNQINSIGPNVFHNLTRLSQLDLSSNGLVNLDANSLRNLLRLDLNLANNELSNLDSDLFDPENVAILNELNLSHNNFTDFPLDALRKQAANLISLDISSNSISHLATNTDLLVNLKQLDISSNPLSAPAIRVLFTEPKSVKYLNVADTRITEFKFETFELPYLTHLNVSNNRLKTMNSSLFEKLNLLEVLDLSRNAFADLRPFADVWPYLPNLRKLVLAHNQFRTIQKDDFANLNNLVSLDASSLRQLVDLDCESIARLSYLSELMIYNYTQLRNYELQECFASNSKLSKLFIEIKLAELKGHLFNSYSTKLTQLFIYGPKLTRISPNFLYGVRSRHLDLTLFNTSIRELSLGVFSSLSLKCEIQFSIYSANEFLFTNNQLAELNSKQLNVRVGDLQNVSLPCDCSIETLYKMMRGKQQYTLNGQRKSIFLSSLIDQFDNLTCNQPANLVGFRLSEIDFNDVLCAENNGSSGGDLGASDNNNYSLINNKDNKSAEKTDLVELSTNQPVDASNRTTTTANYNLNHSDRPVFGDSRATGGYTETTNNLNANRIGSSGYADSRPSSSGGSYTGGSTHSGSSYNGDSKVTYSVGQSSTNPTGHAINQDHLLTKSSMRRNKNNLRLKTKEDMAPGKSQVLFTKVDTIIIGSTVGAILFILVLMIICCFGMRIKTPPFDQSYFNYANSANLFGQPFVTTRNQSSLESNCTCLKASCNQSPNSQHQPQNHSPYSSSLNNSLLNFSPQQNLVYQQQTDLEPMTMFYMK